MSLAMSLAAPLRGGEPGLVLHLPLDAMPAVDAGPHRLAIAGTGDLRVAEGRAAVTFPGSDGRLTVAESPALKLGTGEFTVALWMHTDDVLSDSPGDLLAKYDPATRTGFSLSLRCNTGVTSSQANWRQLQFGIDQGRTPQWRDEGRPGEAILGFSMCAHDGHLYVGTCEPAAGRGARVYRYDGPGEWADLGTLDGSNSVSALAAFQGRLYAGTAKYRLRGSALEESPNETLGGRIYRYDGDRWTLCGQLPQTEAVGGLVVFQNRLYAASLYKPAGFFRLEPDGTWASLPVPDEKRVESLGLFNGALYATSYDGGRVYRFDGQKWSDLGVLGDNTQTYSFATYGRRLHVGTWPSGKVFRLGTQDAWEDAGRLGEELEVMGLCAHNGKLYGGTLPLAEVHRLDDAGWTRLEQLDRTPDVKYRRVWTMAQFQGRLFCTTLPSGHIHSLDAGACVTHDRELPPGWHHVAAVRRMDRLELYVDGRRVAESATFMPADYDLTTAAPLTVGSGPVDDFQGRMSDVRIFNRALTPDDVRELAR